MHKPTLMHHVYHTRAFILGSQPFGEANTYVRLFTEDLGLIFALAQGIRRGASKLRYSLQDFSLTNISLVRGKDIWRITSVREDLASLPLLRNWPEAFHMSARILNLVGRLVDRDEKNESLFSIILNAYTFIQSELAQKKDLSHSLLPNLECITVLKIIHNLGYGKDEQQLSSFVEENITENLIVSMNTYRSLALSVINNALTESHL